jgi:hypothetical protein
MRKLFRRSGVVLILSAGVLVLATWAGRAVAQDVETLENGRVRLQFNRHTGLFDVAAVAGGVLRLEGAGLSLQSDGKRLSAGEATKVEVRREGFTDQLGEGEKLVVEYAFSGNPATVRYELCLYRGKPWISVTAYLPRGDYALGGVSLVEGKVHTLDAFKTRIYVNSGQAGGNTGVWELGMRQWHSTNLSVLYEPRVHEALSLGFYSFARASTSVGSQYLGPDEIGVDAVIHYHGYRPRGGELRSESLLLNLGPNPLSMLEEWAEAAVKVVQPKFLHDTRTSFINTWYAFGNQATGEIELEQARVLRNSVLYHYGVNFVELGEWQKQRYGPGDGGDELGYGETEEDRTLFPHGVAWLCNQYHALGFGCSFGANYAYAALETSTAKENPPWLIKEDLSRLGFGYPIDFTHPGAQQWVYDLYHRAAAMDAKWVWSDFDGGPTRGKLHDPNKIMRFEDIREGVESIRKAVGPDTFIHRFCCGPYFPALGVVDRQRTGNDMVGIGDWRGLKDVVRQLAGTYMLHQRFWINDPDPLFVGARDYVHNYGAGPIRPDPSIQDEVRMRVQFQVSSGSFLTLGENLDDYTPEKIHLLTLVLPSYGQAARPLDLFEHNTPEIFDLPIARDWEHWHVLMLQNWNDWDKKYDIRFSDMGLDASRSYWIFSFWDQAFVGEFRQSASLRVGARQGETFSIREARRTPWVLGTDLHLTQGGVELEDVRYEASAGRLSGVARRHAGAEGHVVVLVPAGYKLRSATGAYREERQPSGAAVVHLELKFAGETVPWSLSFEKAE